MKPCKVCNSPDQGEIDRHLSQGESSRVIARWTDEIGRPISHTSIAKHRQHAVVPEQAALEEHRNGGKIRLPTVRVSSAEFLEAVVQEGARQIEANPAKVKIDHALRAATALERKREDGKGGIRVLVLALMGHTPPVTIRGTYQQLEGE
jgi:hypothetical protein